MCGICGVLDPARATPAADLEASVAAMAATLAHRGPDDAGTWVDADHGVAFGHRRLSVVDLSDTGRQPMASASGRYVATYNGEVYNHRGLRSALGGVAFRGSSDTEVVLAACDRWGVRGALDRLVGMFALAVWDRRERALWLVRDRMGEKPLYWGRAGGQVVFGSELKALRAHPGVVPAVDRDALALFFRHKYVPSPHTIYRDIEKVPAGHAVVVRADGSVERHRWWDPVTLLPDGEGWGHPEAMDPHEAVDALAEVLGQAVAGQMVADVAVGAFLSGGVDSTAVVATMASLADRPVRTFTIGSADPRFDESDAAAAVARHLGTEHTTLVVGGAEARAVVPRLAEVFDEPFADSSQIPTLLVSGLARDHVTVSLSGDGGDELFGGYNRHRWIPGVWRRLGPVPPGLRGAAGRALGAVPPAWIDGAARVLPAGRRPRLAGTKAAKLAQVAGARSPEAMYLALVSHWPDPARLVLGATEPATLASSPSSWPGHPDLLTRLRMVDLLTYLPDDILTKLDRASMAVGLEARAPLLDHRVVAHALALPPALLHRDGRTKWVLAELARRHVPADLLDRPKAGFGVPVGEWLRGPLRGWAEDLLAPDRLRREEWLDEAPVTRAWRQHQGGRHDHTYRLWDVLMFQAWLDRWMA